MKHRVGVHLTYDCNLRCGHCYDHSYDGGPSMSYGTLDRITDNISSDAGLVYFTGGEALKQWDLLIEAIHLTRSKTNAHIGLMSNGILLNDEHGMERVKKLIDVGLDSISLHGNDTMHYEAGGLSEQEIFKLEVKIACMFDNNIGISVYGDGSPMPQVFSPVGRGKDLPLEFIFERDYCSSLNDYLRDDLTLYVDIKGKAHLCHWIRRPIGDMKINKSRDIIEHAINSSETFPGAIIKHKGRFRKKKGLSKLAKKLGVELKHKNICGDCNKVYRAFKKSLE